MATSGLELPTFAVEAIGAMPVSHFWGSLGPPPAPPPGNWDAPPTMVKEFQEKVQMDANTLVLTASEPIVGTIPRPPFPPVQPMKMLKRWNQRPNADEKSFNPGRS